MILPRKGQEPEAHAELEKRLRVSKSWPAVSMMDMARLRKIWIGDEEDPARVRKTLQKFAKEEEVTKLSLRQRKGAEEE